MTDLIAAIRKIRRLLADGAFSNESEVSKGVVMGLLQPLGWDVFDPNRVSSEFPIGPRKVDYALKQKPFGPVVLVEVKAVGKATPKGEEQLFDYCAKQGVPLAVLTDGQSWSFYFPAGMGTYEQRRFAALRLTNDSAACARLFERYLGFEAVRSGRFREAAQADYDLHRKRIVARDQFESVFDSLIRSSTFLTSFADKVERRCKFRPPGEQIEQFVRQRLGLAGAGFPAASDHDGQSPVGSAANFQPATEPKSSDYSRRRSDVGVPTLDPAPKAALPQGSKHTSPSFTFFGQTVPCATNVGVLLEILNRLPDRFPDAYEQLAQHFKRGKRNYLSRDPGNVYAPNASDHVKKQVVKLPGGWWVGTNSDSRTKQKQLAKIRDVMKLSENQFTWSLKGKTK